MAKRSRRARRTSKPSKSVRPAPVVSATPVAKAAVGGIAPAANNGADDYIDNYYYVYTDMRTMIIITLAMVVAMFGLTFII